MSCESHVPRFVMLVFHNKDGVEPEHIFYGKIYKNLLNFVRERQKILSGFFPETPYSPPPHTPLAESHFVKKKTSAEMGDTPLSSLTKNHQKFS